MKFQKLSENKLKIILSNEELPNSSNLDDFISDSSKARHAILDILEKAYDEVGFNTKDYKIKIDAVALYNGNLIFTITKLVKVKETQKKVKPKKVIKKDNSNFVIYEFENYDDFYSFCLFLKRNHFTKLNSVAKIVELYLYYNKYYLYLYSINENHSQLSKFYSSITEFCRFYSNKDLFVSVLKEKGELLIKNNAFSKIII